MAITIPLPNRNTQASKTPAAQVNVDTDIKFRDIGTGDAIQSLAPLAAAAQKATEAKSTGMMNATYNEGVRIIQKTYNDFRNNNANKGYGAANSVKRAREQVQEKFAKLKAEGFELSDGSKVPALNDNEWSQVLQKLDTKLIESDGTLLSWEANELAQRATNDFQSSVSIALDTVLHSDDPVVQASASNEIAGLARAYYQGRLGEEGVANYARENMQKTLGTRATNLAATNPKKLLMDLRDNPNYSRFGVQTEEQRKTAIGNMAKIAGLNNALVMNGQQPVAQDWSDQDARALMTEMEYALYSVDKAETAQTKAAAIGKDVRNTQNSLNLQLMQDASKVETQGEWNDLVEKTLKSGDSYGTGQTLQAIVSIRDEAELFRNDADYVSHYGDVDGNFNERAAQIEAAAKAEVLGIGNELQGIDKVKARGEYINEYVAIARGNFNIKKERMNQLESGAITSAMQVQKFYETLAGPNAPITPQEVEGITVMTPTDKAVVTEALLKRAELRKTVDNIKRQEGDTFDMSSLAMEAYQAAGKKIKYNKNGWLEEGDPEDFAKFYDRFATLYVKAYSSLNAKPDSALLTNIARNAMETYKEHITSSDFSKDMNNLRLLARRSYDKVEVSQPELRKAIKEYLEAGWWDRTFSLDTEGLSSDSYEAIRELYDELSYTEQQLLIQQIATGGDSLIYRILEQKGFK